MIQSRWWVLVAVAAVLIAAAPLLAQDESDDESGDGSGEDADDGSDADTEAPGDAEVIEIEPDPVVETQPVAEPEPVSITELDRPSLPYWGGYGGFSLGVVFLDLTDVTDFLDRVSVGGAGGFDGFAGAMPTWGIEAHAVLAERFVVGGQVSAYIQYSTGDYFDSAVGGYFGWVDFGYNAYSSLYFNVRPWVGVGGFGMSVLLDGDLRGVEFLDDEDREDDNERAVIYSGTGIVAAGVSLEATPYFSNSGDRFGGMSIQLKLGGFFQLADSPWKYRDERVDDPPDVKFNGGYAAIHVLFGGGVTSR